MFALKAPELKCHSLCFLLAPCLFRCSCIIQILRKKFPNLKLQFNKQTLIYRWLHYFWIIIVTNRYVNFQEGATVSSISFSFQIFACPTLFPAAVSSSAMLTWTNSLISEWRASKSVHPDKLLLFKLNESWQNYSCSALQPYPDFPMEIVSLHKCILDSYV